MTATPSRPDSVPLWPPAGLPELLRLAALEAGALAARWFQPGERSSARAWTKGKSSPVTQADIEVDAFLRRRLGEARPEFGWLSEETADSPDRLNCRLLFVVDPIDGTRAFISGDPRWCVSIAAVADGAPVAGVVHAPALSLTHEATHDGPALLNGAPIRAPRDLSLSGARLAGPRFMLEALENAGTGIVASGKIPSLAHRFCKVADGSLDAALASSDSNDWDIAAAHLILERSGARLCGFDGAAPRYNRPGTTHGRLLAAPAAGFDAMLATLRGVVGLPGAPGAASERGQMQRGSEHG